MTRTFESDNKNDLVLTSQGNISIVDGIYAVLYNCKTAIQAQLGEMQYAVDKGMPTNATAWEDYNPIQVEAAARTIIKSVPEVVEVVSFSMSRIASTLRYTAVIRTTFGVGALNG